MSPSHFLSCHNHEPMHTHTQTRQCTVPQPSSKACTASRMLTRSPAPCAPLQQASTSPPARAQSPPPCPRYAPPSSRGLGRAHPPSRAGQCWGCRGQGAGCRVEAPPQPGWPLVRMGCSYGGRHRCGCLALALVVLVVGCVMWRAQVRLGGCGTVAAAPAPVAGRTAVTPCS